MGPQREITQAKLGVAQMNGPGILQVRHNSGLYSLFRALIPTLYATPAVILLFHHLSQIRQRQTTKLGLLFCL